MPPRAVRNRADDDELSPHALLLLTFPRNFGIIVSFSGSFFFKQDSKVATAYKEYDIMQQSETALGTAKLGKLMLKFAIPCVLSLLVSALYNIVDQIFIGNSELGDLGNAATGAVFPVFVIAQAFAWWFGDGCAAYLNIRQGRNDAERAHRALGTGITLTVAASALLLVVFYPLRRPALLLFGASENSIGYAVEYFNIILGFFPVFMASNMINSLVRADGSPAWAMASMLSGAIVNIVLDATFIFALRLGMAGAAWATGIGQAVSFAVCLYYLLRRTKTFKLCAKSFVPDLREFGNAARLGISSFITQFTIVIIATVGNIMLKKYGGASVYGEDIPIAIMAVESKVFTVVINLIVGIVLGCQPIIGYNVGAKNRARVKRLYLYILLCTLVIGAVATLVFELAPLAVVGMFGAPKFSDPELYNEFAVKLFRIFLMLVVFNGVVKMSSIFFQAAGKPVRAAVASCVRDILCFLPLALVLPLRLGIDGILWAAPISDAAAFAVAVAFTITYFARLSRGKPTAQANERAVYSLAQALEFSPSTDAARSDGASVIITISREHGSGGKRIGQIVAERLGVPFYYKEMIAVAAHESGLDKEFISDVNADSPAVLRGLYMNAEAVSQAVTAQDKAIKSLADRGGCVLVGRAADYVLHERQNVLRVFVRADGEYKAQRVASTYGDSLDDAKKQVKRADAARAAYYKSVSGKAWGDPRNYDLVIDGAQGAERCADLIVEQANKFVGSHE